MFYSLLESAIADHVPTVTIRRKCPPWFDRAVRAALRLKEAAHRRMRRNPSTDTKADFSEQRKVFKKIASSKYYEYLKKLADDLKTNPKRFWTFLKSVGKHSSAVSQLRDDAGNLLSDDTEKAELLNKTFASKFVNSAVNALPRVPAYPLDTLPRLSVSESAVRSALLQLNQTKACGPDNFSAKIILECADQLVSPLTKIFAKSVETGLFPNLWKEANIIPVLKKGDRRNPANYRSISLISLFGKVLEKIVHDQLYTHVSSALCPEQHGFVPNKSCVSNLAVYLCSAWEAMQEGYQTDTIYTDFSSAFQSVNHVLLAHKLENSYHLRDTALQWFVSYLSGRRQRVVVNGKTSQWTAVTSGVPEGSLLAPLAFALYINDLPQNLSSDCLLYADDQKLYRKIKTPSDARLLQEDLDRLQEWCITWGLTLNPSKCKAFTMTLRRKPVQTTYKIGTSALESVTSIRDLGITIDSKLTFSDHLNKTVSQANRALGLLIRSFQTGSKGAKFETKSLLTAYYANVRSILEYGTVVWAGAAKSHTVRVDRVQHKFLMWLNSHCNIPCQSLSYSALSHHFGVPFLSSRRVQHDLLFLKGLFTGKINSAELLGKFPLHVPSRSTRTIPLFAESRARITTVQSGLVCRVARNVNAMLGKTSCDFFTISFITYKHHVIKYISDIPPLPGHS